MNEIKVEKLSPEIIRAVRSDLQRLAGMGNLGKKKNVSPEVLARRSAAMLAGRIKAAKLRRKNAKMAVKSANVLCNP